MTCVVSVDVNRFLLGYGLNISPDSGGNLVEEKLMRGCSAIDINQFY